MIDAVVFIFCQTLVELLASDHGIFRFHATPVENHLRSISSCCIAIAIAIAIAKPALVGCRQMCQMSECGQLDNLGTVMTQYSRQTFTKGAFQWTKCVVHHLYAVYSSVSDQIIAFLVEVTNITSYITHRLSNITFKCYIASLCTFFVHLASLSGSDNFSSIFCVTFLRLTDVANVAAMCCTSRNVTIQLI